MFEVEFVFRSARKGPKQQASLSPDNLFSAMPPLETARNVSESGPVLFNAHCDISRAQFMPRAEKEVFVDFPMEDLVKANGYVGRLERPAHGTQDASQEDPNQR